MPKKKAPAKTLQVTQVTQHHRLPARPEGAPSRRSASSGSTTRSSKADTPAVRGMIFKVKHLVKVEEL